MLPQSYQTIFRKDLSEQQYLTLEILLLLIQILKNQGFNPHSAPLTVTNGDYGGKLIKKE
ncbi:hypothetical protein FJR06_16660 [Dolichospermum sp. UHCC 0352]|nr:hypothetical protein [Dolichospermum sp. UHCC 0352]